MCTLKVGKDIHCPDLSNKRSQYLIPAHFPKAGLCNSKLKIWFCLYFLHDPFMTVDVYIDWMIYWLDDWLTECYSPHLALLLISATLPNDFRYQLLPLFLFSSIYPICSLILSLFLQISRRLIFYIYFPIKICCCPWLSTLGIVFGFSYLPFVSFSESSGISLLINEGFFGLLVFNKWM